MANQTITVDFNANLARFSSSIDKATADLNRFQSNASRIGGQIKSTFAGLSAGLSVGAFAGWIKSTIDAADNMRDLAIATGTSVKALASYQLAAEQSGTSIDSVARGIGKLSIFMAQNADEARNLGLTAKDPARALIQLSAALEKAATPADRNAIAMRTLGKSYEELMPLLAQGSVELERQIQAAGPYADRLEGMADAADQFNDSLAQMKQQASDVGITIAGPVVKALNEAFAAANAATAQFGALGGAMAGLGKLGTVGQTIGVLWANVAYVFKGVGNEIGGLAAQLASLASGNFRQAGIISSAMKRDAALARTELDALEKRILGITTGQSPALTSAGRKSSGTLAFTDLEKGAKRTGQAKLDVIDPFYAQRTAAEKARADDIRRFVEGQQNDINDLNSAMADDAKRAADAYAASLEGLISNTTLAKTERMQESIDILNRAFFEGDIGAQQYDEAIQQITASTEKLAETVKETDDIAKELGLTFSSAFEDAVVSGKSFSDILKGIYQDILRITVRKTVTEPLSAGFSSLLKGISLPGFAVGTDYVPRDMVAVVHKGEAIIPASENKRSSGMTINMTVMAQDASSFRKSMGQIQADLAFAVQGARRFA